MSQPIRGRDLRALHAANAALLDLDATAADTADRLVAALGPAFGIESAWGLEVPPAAGGTAAPAPFADRASTDLADAVAGLAVLAPDAVTPRERAAADAALRILAGTTHATWHVEEFPRRLGAATYRAFQDTAIYRALFAPGRGAVATGFVTAGPRPASLVLSRRRPDRPDRRARARPLPRRRPARRRRQRAPRARRGRARAPAGPRRPRRPARRGRAAGPPRRPGRLRGRQPPRRRAAAATFPLGHAVHAPRLAAS